MNFLEKYGLKEEDIKKIENNYEKSLISNISYKKDNVCLLLDYFQGHNFDLKTLLFNRLDLFLIDYQKIKKRISKYDEEKLLSYLQDDISLIDNLG